jgi:hypothetical protein
MDRGSVACHGSSTGLKTQYGDGYSVSCSDGANPDNVSTWKFSTSAEATRKVLELERAGVICDVTFPTLEQAFLKLTPESGNMHRINDDGAMLGKAEGGATTDEDDNNNNEPEAAAEPSPGDPVDLNLDVRRSIGILRQTWVLFRKRCILLQSNWFSYLVNLAVPIIVAAALYKFLQSWETLVTCDEQREVLYPTPFLQGTSGLPSMSGLLDDIAAVGPADSFSSGEQNQLLIDSM